MGIIELTEIINRMSSVSDKAIVDEVKANNGGGVYPGQDVEYIIEYHNIFDRAPTWKLCRNKKEYEHHMENGAFINPRLVWAKT
tara:strand:+ start:30 stop:281 length:252 start_codon:yes stop_codon:yes gene_type:complete